MAYSQYKKIKHCYRPSLPRLPIDRPTVVLRICSVRFWHVIFPPIKEHEVHEAVGQF